MLLALVRARVFWFSKGAFALGSDVAKSMAPGREVALGFDGFADMIGVMSSVEEIKHAIEGPS
jgi:hypothetical protein